MSQNEILIVSFIKNGNPVVNVEELYNKHYSELFRFGYQLSQSDELSRDLVQEAFLKLAATEKKRFREIENKRAWLFRVVYNEFISHIRRDERAKLFEAHLLHSRPEEPDMTEGYDRMERRKIVRNEMKKLSDNECALLFLYCDGFSYLEIGEILNINFASVGNSILRAKGKLIKNLKTKYHGLFE